MARILFLLFLALVVSGETSTLQLRTKECNKQLEMHRYFPRRDYAYNNSLEDLKAQAPKLMNRSYLLEKYELRKRVGKGAFGEVWLAFERGHTRPYVIKKINATTHGIDYWTARREIYFGQKLWSMEGVSRFVEAFDVGDEFYIVFWFEGVSLDKLLYGQLGNSLESREWWIWMKTTSEGQQAMKNIIYQLLSAVNRLHKKEIAHFDLKPANLVVCFGIDCGETDLYREDFRLKAIDFGMALNEYTFHHLQGALVGQTMIYMSPESLQNHRDWTMAPPKERLSYDIWTIGVIFLEMILGEPHVFKITRPEYKAALEKFLFLNKHTLPNMDRFIGFAEMCIDVLGFVQYNEHCLEDNFAEYIRSRDPLHIGFPDILAQQLIEDLLRWDPDARITARRALQHLYFRDLRDA